MTDQFTSDIFGVFPFALLRCQFGTLNRFIPILLGEQLNSNSPPRFSQNAAPSFAYFTMEMGARLIAGRHREYSIIRHGINPHAYLSDRHHHCHILQYHPVAPFVASRHALALLGVTYGNHLTLR